MVATAKYLVGAARPHCHRSFLSAPKFHNDKIQLEFQLNAHYFDGSLATFTELGLW